MRILMVNFGYYPAVGWGGPVKVVQQNAAELRRRGHELTVATSNMLNKQQRLREYSYQAEIDGIPVHYLQTHNLSFWPGTLGPTWLTKGAKREMQKLVAWSDIVHVNGVRNALALNGLTLAIEQDKPVVLQPHGTLQYIESSIRLKRAFDSFYLKEKLSKVDAFVALQQHEANQIKAAGAPAQKIHVVANGLDGNLQAELGARPGVLRRTYQIPDDSQIILFLGRINHKKGVDLLVEAFAALPGPFRENRYLIIAGPDDGQLAEVQTLVAKYSLQDQVYFPGLLSGDDVWSAYADADLFVLPCRTDTFPMTVVEACAAGVPIVMTETCEIVDLFDEQSAKIVSLEVSHIAEGMRQVLDDEALSQLYQHNARALMEVVFSIEAVGDDLEAIYLNVTAGRREAAAL